MRNSLSSKSSKTPFKTAIALLAVGIATAPAVLAQSNSENAAGQHTNVVAHVELSGGPVTRMLLVKKDSKPYLLLGLDSSSAVVIFDVSKPSQPQRIDATAGATGAPAAELKVVADTLTLFGTSENPSAGNTRSTPKEIHNLSGVTAYVTDKAHRLVYAANGEGLWIVKMKQRFEAEIPIDYYGGGG